jgi:hypothetical protein
LWNLKPGQPPVLVNPVHEWAWRVVGRLDYTVIRTRKREHLFPPGRVRTPKIEDTDIMLPNGLQFVCTPVKHVVVSNHEPATPADVRQPLVVRHFLQEGAFMLSNCYRDLQLA